MNRIAAYICPLLPGKNLLTITFKYQIIIQISYKPRDQRQRKLTHRNRTQESLMQTESVKAQAHRLVDNLPDSATWEDVMYRIYVRESVEAGIKDSDEGRTVDVKEVRKKFGLTT